MNRANRSESLPNDSGSYSAARDRAAARAAGRRGCGSRGAAATYPASRDRAVLLALLAPVLGQQVVQHVVDADGADQAVVLVDNRCCYEVVGREVAGDSAAAGVSGDSGSMSVSAIAADEGRRGLAQQPLDVRDAEVAPGRGLVGRPADVDLAGQCRRDVAGYGRGPAPRRSSRWAAGSPARWSSDRRRCPRRTRAGVVRALPRPAPSAAAGVRRRRSAARPAGRRRRPGPSPRARRPRGRPRGRPGSRPGRPRAAPRARRRAARRRAPPRPRCGACWTGRASRWRGRPGAASRTPRACWRRPGCPRAARGPRPRPTRAGAAARAGGCPCCATCTATRVRCQSRLRPCSMAASRTVACGAGVDDGDLAVEQLGQHEGLAGPGVEAAQADTVPVPSTTASPSAEVTRPIGTKMARRCWISTDESEHAGRLAADAQGHDGITHPADLVALRVEDGHTGKARDVDPARRAAHGVEVTARLQRRSGSDPLTSRHADTALPPGGRLHRPALRRQPAGRGPRRRRPRHHRPGTAGAAVRPLRDGVPDAAHAQRTRPRAPTTGCGSSPPGPSWPSPASRRSAPRGCWARWAASRPARYDRLVVQACCPSRSRTSARTGRADRHGTARR